MIHRLKSIQMVFLDVGASIDAISGIIDVDRPFASDWTNYRLMNLSYMLELTIWFY